MDHIIRLAAQCAKEIALNDISWANQSDYINYHVNKITILELVMALNTTDETELLQIIKKISNICQLGLIDGSWTDMLEHLAGKLADQESWIEHDRMSNHDITDRYYRTYTVLHEVYMLKGKVLNPKLRLLCPDVFFYRTIHFL